MKAHLPRCLLVCCLPIISAPPTFAQTKTDPIKVHVDATDAGRRILRATLEIPAKPGPLTLYYPKWIPGEHGPTGPITDLAGIKIKAAGQQIPWERDEVDMYAFHVKVPEKAGSLEVTINFLSPGITAGFSSGASMTQHLAVINWNQVVLYPKGPTIGDIWVQPTIKLPAGWDFGTPLDRTAQKTGDPTFELVPLDTLLDSPVICGLHFKEIAIGPKEGPRHFIEVAADSAAALEMSAATQKNMDRLIVEADKLFGVHHYKSYRFLLSLSDQVAHFGLEHHQSSDNRGPEGLLIEDRMKKNDWAWLMPHEYVHSWNGKFRRPADMVTATFQEPQRTKYLWVYEGLTQYLGMVLTARCGLWTAEQFRDNLAHVGDWSKNQRGRTWRPLEDTTVAAQLLYNARSDWAAWRRGVDFYDEGLLIWLDVDTLIRDKTKGKKSLDDFCRRFFGGKEGDFEVKPYHLEELVADLNAVTPHDWKAYFHQRLTSNSPEPPLDGIRRGGWKLVYTEKTNDMIKENDSENKTMDLTASLGLMLKEEGNVQDVIPGKPAYKAGMGPGMKVLAINSRRWTDKGFHQALVASKKTGKIEVVVENGEYIRTLTIPYQEGERYPHLEQEKGAPDWLGEILKPLGPVEKGEKES